MRAAFGSAADGARCQRQPYMTKMLPLPSIIDARFLMRALRHDFGRLSATMVTFRRDARLARCRLDARSAESINARRISAMPRSQYCAAITGQYRRAGNDILYSAPIGIAYRAAAGYKT